MGTLDRAIARSDFLVGCIILEGSWGLKWRLLHVTTTLAALPLSSFRTVASHITLMGAAKSLLVLHLRSVESLVRDRRTHARSFKKTRGAFV